MTEIQFKEFIEEIIPQQLFHVDSKDVDDESSAKLEEVILVGLIAGNPQCLGHRPLQWFLDTFLTKTEFEQPTLKQEEELGNHLQGEIEKQIREELEQELERQILERLVEDDMISTDDIFTSREEELFRQIQEDERSLNEKIKSWDDGGCSTGLNSD